MFDVLKLAVLSAAIAAALVTALESRKGATGLKTDRLAVERVSDAEGSGPGVGGVVRVIAPDRRPAG